MGEVVTKYGVIKGIVSSDFYSEGTLRECKLNEYSQIATKYGVLVPQYTEDEARRKYINSLTFYRNGNIKSIALQEISKIITNQGSFSAELVTFYEDENIKRIFPFNGKITGYWTEENEYELCPEFEFGFEFAEFKKKVIGIQFYESEAIKSITFWPKDLIDIQAPFYSSEVRIGLSLYENGKIKSCEPSKPTLVKTPIGDIAAYDVNALAINGDNNSLCFNEDGTIKSMITSTDKIEVVDEAGHKFVFETGFKPNLFNNNIMDIVPVNIDFDGDKVIFNKNEENQYEISRNIFDIQNLAKKITKGCNDCSNCTSCR